MIADDVFHDREPVIDVDDCTILSGTDAGRKVREKNVLIRGKSS